MPKASKSRKTIIKEITPVFRDKGGINASLADLAHATSLSKSSLYHFFPNGKNGMISAVTYMLNKWTKDEVHCRIGGDPAGSTQRVLAQFSELYNNGRTNCVLAALALSGSMPEIRIPVQEVFKNWLWVFERIASELPITSNESAYRAEDAVIRLQGALILAGVKKDPAVFERALKNIQRDLCAFTPRPTIGRAGTPKSIPPS